MSAENVQNGPSFEVPRPQELKPSPETTPTPGIEQGGLNRESAPTTPAHTTPAMPLPQAPASPIATPAPDIPQDLSRSTTISDLPAKDVDLIEKQWVQKAKTIVNQTHDDPAKQKEQLSQLGADYQYKRFNRKLNSSDTPA